MKVTASPNLHKMISSRKKIKLQLVRTMKSAGIFWLSRRWHASKMRALLYHRFSSSRKRGFVSRDTFERQIRYIHDTFQVLSPDSLYRHDHKWDHGVIITVDDGYCDFYNVAYPVLRETRTPAIVYLTTDFIDQQTWLWFDRLDYILQRIGEIDFPFTLIDEKKRFSRSDASQILGALKEIDSQEREAQIASLAEYCGIAVPETIPEEYAPLSWNQVREMAANGIAFGSHTCTHPILTRSDAESARWEVRHSKTRIEEEVGRPVISFAYPNGNYNEEIIQIVRDSRYEYAFCTKYGFFNQHDERYKLSRVAIGDYPLVYFGQDLCGVNILKQRVLGISGKDNTF